MKNIEVIQLILDRVNQQGYRLKDALTKEYTGIKVTEFEDSSGQVTVEVRGKSGREKLLLNIRQLLFDLPFARALFGDFWETHLNLMACSSDHLDYLKRYLLQPD